MKSNRGRRATVGQSFADVLLSVIFPSRCMLCGEPVESLADGLTCAACWATLDWLPAARCARCHAPVKAPVEECPACPAMALDRLRFLGPYTGALRAHLLFLKRKPYVCRRLREEIGKRVATEPIFREVELVLPVPLHPRRQRERGYNQAELLAEEVARALICPLRRDVLRRVIYTEPHRAGMDAQARARRVAQCFVVTSPKAVWGKTVLLVDDVYTTGATLNECARTVRAAGARAVYGFVVARAIGETSGS